MRWENWIRILFWGQFEIWNLCVWIFVSSSSFSLISFWAPTVLDWHLCACKELSGPGWFKNNTLHGRNEERFLPVIGATSNEWATSNGNIRQSHNKTTAETVQCVLPWLVKHCITAQVLFYSLQLSCWTDFVLVVRFDVALRRSLPQVGRYTVLLWATCVAFWSFCLFVVTSFTVLEACLSSLSIFCNCRDYCHCLCWGYSRYGAYL